MQIEMLTETPEVGRIYTGKVVGMKNFGVFVEIAPGTDGMVHISQLDTQRVNTVEDVVGMGDQLAVGSVGRQAFLKAGRLKRPSSKIKPDKRKILLDDDLAIGIEVNEKTAAEAVIETEGIENKICNLYVKFENFWERSFFRSCVPFVNLFLT